MPAGSFAGTGESPGDGIPSAFPEVLDRLSRAVADAAADKQLWLARIRVGLQAALEFLDDEPQCTSRLAAETPLDGLLVSEGTRRAHAALGEVLNAGRGTVIVGVELTPSTLLIAELVLTAVLSVIRAELLKDDPAPLASLAPSLLSFIVEPYLGAGAANADAHRDLSERARAAAKVLPIRPHPTIIGALGVIASTPGLSSRQLETRISKKDASGSDISDVLKRLRQRGLIENTRQARNLPNAWRLTPYGRRILELVTDEHGRERLDGLARRPSRRGATRAASSSPGHVVGRAA